VSTFPTWLVSVAGCYSEAKSHTSQALCDALQAAASRQAGNIALSHCSPTYTLADKQPRSYPFISVAVHIRNAVSKRMLVLEYGVHTMNAAITRGYVNFYPYLKIVRGHELFTEEVNKVALSAEDDKRVIRTDGVHTLAIKHYRNDK